MDSRDRWLLSEISKERDALRADVVKLQAENDALQVRLGQEMMQRRKEADGTVRADKAEAELATLRADLERREGQYQVLTEAVADIVANSEPQPPGGQHVLEERCKPAKEEPSLAFGYCAICYHPLDRCSHCNASFLKQKEGDK